MFDETAPPEILRVFFWDTLYNDITNATCHYVDITSAMLVCARVH